MKLSEIYLENVLHLSQHRIGNFSNGLNVIYGERGTGKSTIRQLIRDTFYGTNRYLRPSNSPINSVIPKCRITVASSVGDSQLERDFANNGELFAASVHDRSLAASKTITNPLKSLKQELFDTIFSFSIQQTASNASLLSHALRTELDVPAGRDAIGEKLPNLNWSRETEVRRQRVATINQRIDSLQQSRQQLLLERERLESGRLARLTEIDREIQSLTLQINQLEVTGKRAQLAFKEREINELRLLVEEALRMESFVPAPSVNSHRSDLFQLIYARLDELDNQIRRWKGLQADIQNQRIRLKDEMTAWGELTLDSTDHPYHNARRVLTTLEEQVLQADFQARQWEAAPANRTDPSQSVRAIQSICQAMKSELYALSQELSVQYKNIRHRGAASELKYLRHCHDAISDNIERLILRRDVIVSEIRSIDPAGAEAVVRAEQPFVHCAQHEGFFAARKKFVGAIPVQQEASPVPRTDVAELRRRLHVAQTEFNDLQRWIVDSDVGLAGLKTRLAQLELERSGYSHSISDPRLAELVKIDQELVLLRDELGKLMQLLAESPAVATIPGNPILLRAAALLQQVTDGELRSVWLSDKSSSGLETLDRNNQVRSFSGLDSRLQDAAFLALTFAAKEELADRGVVFPMLIDDMSDDRNNERLASLAGLFTSMVQEGHQIVLFTSQNQLDSRLTVGGVFALPNRTESVSITSILPKLSESIPVTVLPSLNQPISPLVVANHRLDNLEPLPRLRPYEFEKPMASSARGVDEYPFSKYDLRSADESLYRDQSPIRDHSIVNEQSDFIVPYPSKGVRSVRNQAPGRATPVSVDSVAGQADFAPSFDELTSLDRLDLFDFNRLRTLSEIGIETVGQLLELNPEELPALLRDRGISSDQIDRWQATAWLLSNIPGLRVVDARILVACGITEPEHLATSHSHQLMERIQRFLNSSEGQRHGNSVSEINLTRINGWLRALETTRARWQRGSGMSRIMHRRPIGSKERNLRSAHRDTSVPRSNGPTSQSDPNTFGHSSRKEVHPIRTDLLPQREIREPFISRPRTPEIPNSVVMPAPHPAPRSPNREPERPQDFRNERVNPISFAKRESRPEREPRREREPRFERESEIDREPRLKREAPSEREPRFERESRPVREQTPDRARGYENEVRNVTEPRIAREPSIARDPHVVQEPRIERSLRPQSSLRKDAEPVRSSSVVHEKRDSQNSDKHRFYLELKDHIEAAPSIGPKTAELFERIGVATVEEFLHQPAESLAAKLKYKKITPDLIFSWQHQARLVCRMPNLRGHDAQLLVGCNFTEPEKIAGMQPQRLLDVILPYARSKEGLKIIRSGREPDLQEVTDWIKWASMTRSLHAA